MSTPPSTPQTKTELLARIERSWNALGQAIASRTADQLSHARPGEWTIQDHLAHISEWENFILRNQFQGLPVPAALQMAESALSPFEIDRLNALLFERNRRRPLASVLEDFHATHARLVAALEEASDEELARRTSCIGSELNPVLIWVLYNTSDHYDEHLHTIQSI